MKEKLFGLVNSLKEKFQKSPNGKPNTESNTPERGEVPPYKQQRVTKKKIILITGVGFTTLAIGVLGFLMFFGGEDEENIPHKRVLIHRPTPPLPSGTVHKKPYPQTIAKNDNHPPAPEKILPKKHSTTPVSEKPLTAQQIGLVEKSKKNLLIQNKNPSSEESRSEGKQPVDIVATDFVGEQIKKALEEIKEEIKSELEKRTKGEKEKIKDKSFNIVIELPNLPSVITVNKVAELPDGTKMVYYNGKWLTKGVEVDNGWKVIAIDDKYIYLKKTVEKTVRKDGKLQKISLSKVIKVGYIVSF
jgi:hypothetical protein